MQARFLVLCSVLGALPAQTAITTPAGYGATEGNAQFFFWGPNRRMQGLDASNPAPAVWTRLSFRRDGPPAANAGYGPRTFNYQVKLGSVNWSLISNEMDANYSSSPTIVYPMAQTNFPDWTNPPAVPPAPFDMTVLFNAPYSHAGGPFAWDIEMNSSTITTLVPMDRQYIAYASATGSVLGAGCIATGRTTAFGHTAAARNGGAALGAYGMHLQVAGTNAPASAPIYLLLDLVDANLSAPFLCQTVHALAIPPIAIGQSSATGAFLATHLGFPHTPGLIGQPIISQLLSIDPGQPAPFLPLVLSNGRSSVMPADPAGTAASAYIWVTSPATSGTVFFGGCPVGELR